MNEREFAAALVELHALGLIELESDDDGAVMRWVPTALGRELGVHVVDGAVPDLIECMCCGVTHAAAELRAGLCADCTPKGIPS